MGPASNKKHAVKKVKPDRAAMPAHTTSLSWTQWLVPVLISALTFVAFLPALQNGFVDWDDPKNLLANPNYRGLGWTQLRWMFTTFYMGHYQPLSWVTLGLDYLLWGMGPLGYHLTNLLLHAANAVLFYFLTVRLLSLSAPSAAGDRAVIIAAGFSALLFAVHPLRVESVAWVTERRDVLSGLFFLLTLLCYLKAVTGEQRNFARSMTLALVVYGLSLLSKAIGMTLPLVLLVLDFYPLRRLEGGPGKWFEGDARKVWLEKIPFLILALVTGIVALLAQQEAGALTSLARYGVTFRLAQAFFGLAFYLWKTLIPLDLSPLYEPPRNFTPWDFPVIFSGLVVLAITVGLFAVRRRWPVGLASWVCYILLLVPVLGVTQSGPQLVADRYSYLPCLGWAVLAGAGLLYLLRALLAGRIESGFPFFLIGLVGLVPVELGVLTWKQAQVWHDSERLWRRVLFLSPRSVLAHANLGNVFLKRGELDVAVRYYREALRLRPEYADAHSNLGAALASVGKVDEAIEHYREALRLRPDYADAHYNLGVGLFRLGKLDEAMEHYREALRIEPDYVTARYNLGALLSERGRLDEAMEHYREALRIEPNSAAARYNLGVLLARVGKLDEAIGYYREALRIQPGFPEAQAALSQALSQQLKH
jgi:tetratricopeptide (TPR) repeat protein